MATKRSKSRRDPRSKATIRKDGSIHKLRHPVMSPYLITVSNKNKKRYVTKEELDSVLIELVKTAGHISIHHISYELGKKYGQLHVHAIITVKSTFRYKGHVNYPNNYYIDFKFLKGKDILKAIHYVNKESHPCRQEQNFITNYYRHNYGFISATA